MTDPEAGIEHGRPSNIDPSACRPAMELKAASEVRVAAEGAAGGGGGAREEDEMRPDPHITPPLNNTDVNGHAHENSRSRNDSSVYDFDGDTENELHSGVEEDSVVSASDTSHEKINDHAEANIKPENRKK